MCFFVALCVCVCMCVFLSKFEFESHPPFTFLAAFPQKALSYPNGFHINTYTNIHTIQHSNSRTHTNKHLLTHLYTQGKQLTHIFKKN